MQSFNLIFKLYCDESAPKYGMISKLGNAKPLIKLVHNQIIDI